MSEVPAPGRAGEPDERLCSILLDFLESADRGAPADSAELLARHPEFAPELKDFLDTWVHVHSLTAPLRSVSQTLLEASGFIDLPPIEDAGPSEGAVPTRLAAPAEPKPSSTDSPAQDASPQNGWLTRWLHARPPITSEHYPFLHAADETDDIGRLGPYRLFEIVGSGGMGVVFRGEDVALQRPVAVKILRAELAADPGARDRFLREARAAAAIAHDNIITVYHVGEEAGIPFLGMQWLSGMTLEDLLRRKAPLSVPEVLRLGEQIVAGLAAAHGKGLLHRDIKPANLWVERFSPRSLMSSAGAGEAAAESRIRILDFGLARAISDDANLTKSGVTLGTPAYAAPEQAAGRSVDVRSDLFSLGVVLYRMCTGRLPYPSLRAAPGSTTRSHPAIPVRDLNADVPPQLADLVMQLVARDPMKRPASTLEVLRHFRAVTTGSGPQTLTDAAEVTRIAPVHSFRAVRAVRRRAALTLVLTVILLILGYAFSGTLVRFAANQGEVVIVVDDPEMNVTVREAGALIEDKKSHRTITLSAGDHQLEVTVRDDDGESHFFTKAFSLRRGGKEIINVRQELAASATIPEAVSTSNSPKPTGTQHEIVDRSERNTAEWALARGGTVTIRVANRESEVRAAKELPAAPFQVVALDLTAANVNDSNLSGMGRPAELRSLRLSRMALGDQGLRSIGELGSLHFLRLNGTRITNSGIASLSSLNNLVELDLSSTAVSDAGLPSLIALTKLHSLNLYDTRVTDAGLAHVGRLTGLHELYLSDNRLSDSGIAHLRDLTELRILHLNNAPITNEGLVHLAGMKKLRSLNIPGTGVTDDGLSHLEALTALEELALDNTKVSDSGLSKLAALKNLKAINLGNPRITDAAMASVGKLTGLRQLGLFGSKVTDAGLAQLSALTELEVFNVGGLPVTEEGIVHLAKATRLYRLELGGTRVTDASIKPIISCNWPLRYLGLRDSRVSAKGYSFLKTTYPMAEIPWSEPNYSVAESVLAAGGTVWIRSPDRKDAPPIKRTSELPLNSFVVTRYRLPRPGKLPGDLPAKLAALTDPQLDGLEGVDLFGGPCDLSRLKSQLPKTVVELSLDDARVSDSDLANLQNFGLRHLSLQGCPTTAAGLVQLKASPKLAEALTNLSLARTQIGDADLIHLQGLPKLQRLDLGGCPIRGPGLASLKGLTQLRELNLACPTLTDLFAEELGGLRQIEKLSLAGCSLTDDGLKPLYGLSNLRELDLSGTKVTAAGASALKKALPNCRIRSISDSAK